MAKIEKWTPIFRGKIPRKRLKEGKNAKRAIPERVLRGSCKHGGEGHFVSSGGTEAFICLNRRWNIEYRFPKTEILAKQARLNVL
jgi:hypothetical protein